EQCLGPRVFDVSQFLLKIVRNVGKPRTLVSERDHQGTLGAGDEIDGGAGGTHGAVHAQPIADPGRPEAAWQRRARADRMRDRNVARLRENEALPTSGCALRDPISPDAPWSGKKVAAVASTISRR